MNGRSRAARQNAVVHLGALLLCAWALSRGVQTTRNLDWPGDPDHLRDIGHAQTIQDGSFTADPSYLGERYWYNPLVPTLVAGLSSALGIPIHVLHARGGAYLNIAAPLAFYAMSASLLGAPSALAALAAFLVLSPDPSWLTATYSPWLFAANFVQAFFYIGILVYLRAYRRRDTRLHLLAGLVLGITFLGHTAPAVLLGTIIMIATVDRVVRDAQARRQAVVQLLVVLGVAAAVASPLLLSIVWHYGLRVKNTLPSSWLDESLRVDRWRVLLTANLARPLSNALLVVAAARLLLSPPKRRGTRLVIVAWVAAAVALLLWAAYAPQVAWLKRVPPIVPAHHFLLYVRAAEAMLVGHGVWVAASFLARAPARVKNQADAAPRALVARLITLAVVAVLVVVTRPAQDIRLDFGAIRPRALKTYADADSRQLYAWLREHSRPQDVFLTAENSGLSFITVAGRKSVCVPRFFSNPYVHFEPRDEARRHLWNLLDAGDCAAFTSLAAKYSVSHVLAIEGSTPIPPPGRCGLESAFSVGMFTVLRVPR